MSINDKTGTIGRLLHEVYNARQKGREGARRGQEDRFMKIGLLACNRDCNTLNNIVLGIGRLHKLSLRHKTDSKDFEGLFQY